MGHERASDRSGRNRRRSGGRDDVRFFAAAPRIERQSPKKDFAVRAGPGAAPRARASVDAPPRRATASLRRVGRDTHLSEVTRVVLVHHNPVVVLATGVTATGGMLAVLADTTMARGHVTALLAVLVSLL
jgi:hypothetical protein